MAPTLAIPTEQRSQVPTAKLPKPKPQPLVCFSFAAYAGTIINHLRSLYVDVLPGLTDDEISAVESAFSFSFPPDLRSILQVGLPVGRHFPNWRAGSAQQLRVLLNLPALYLSKNVVRNGFWVGSWGPRPKNDDAAMFVVKNLLEQAPVLIPLYGNCYIPSTTPNLAGNPVFYIDGDEISVLSFDVNTYFLKFDRLLQNAWSSDGFDNGADDREARNLPAWAATEARRVNFWSEAAEIWRNTAAPGNSCVWWRMIGDEGLKECLNGAYRKLRDGGWREDEVREMMMDGCDKTTSRAQNFWRVGDGEGMKRRGEVLSSILLLGGWSREDVIYALDLDDDYDYDYESNGCNGHPDGGIVIEARSCVGKDHEKSSMKTLMHLLSLEAE